MGTVAEAALNAGGTVIGVIPKALADREIAHTGLTELIVVPSMHERKARMAALSDGFLALPGGFGTWEEFCEMVTWGQLHLHEKPCGLLNVAGFYDPLLAFFDHAAAAGFVRPEPPGDGPVRQRPARRTGADAGIQAADGIEVGALEEQL